MEANEGTVSIRRDMPVIIGHNQEHIMGRAEVFRHPDRVVIYIVAEGSKSQDLAELLEQPELIALNFAAIPPAQNTREKRVI